MSECYKCQRQLPEGQVECPGGCDGVPLESEVDLGCTKEDKDFQENWMEVDWDKVKSLKDLVAVLRAAQPLFVWKQDPDFERLKKFLKPIED